MPATDTVVIGIDAATKSGYAIIAKAGTMRERLLAYGTVGGDDPDGIARVCNDWAGRLGHAIIERPFLSINLNTTERLCQIVGRWQMGLSMYGRVQLEAIELMRADTWQKAILTGFINGRSERAERKRYTRLWVKAWYGADVKEDEADAIGLATAGARKLAFATRARL